MSRFDFLNKKHQDDDNLENNSNFDENIYEDSSDNLFEENDGSYEESPEEFDSTDENFEDEENNNVEDKDYIEREVAFEEEISLMDALLSDARDLENDLGINQFDDDGLSTSLEEENNREIEEIPDDEQDIINQYEPDDEIDNSLDEENDNDILDDDKDEEAYIEEDPFKDENSYDGEIEEPYEPSDDEPFEYREDEGEFDDDPNNYYDESEISSKRRKSKNSNIALKLIVGVVAIIVIAGLAYGIRYLMNSGKLFNKNPDPQEQEQTNEIQTVEPSIEDITNPTPVTPTPTSLDNVSSGVNIDSELKDDEPVKQTTEVSSFLQTFTGFVVDINSREIFVSDKLNSDQEKLLKSDFEAYVSDTDAVVFISESLYNEINGISNGDEEDSSGPIIIGAASEPTNSSSNDDRYYHSGETCESSGLIGMQSIKLSEIPSDFIACPDCGDLISQIDKNVLNYDYSLNPDLASIVYKRFNIDAEALPVWTTIGSKVTISYIQNEETLLNDIIEVVRAKNNVSNNASSDDNENNQSVDDLDDFRISDSSIFGSEFDSIVAIINDRRKGETSRPNALDDELTLTGTATKDSLSAELVVENCPYLWIQVTWKKNTDTPSVPDLKDVTVELQTPSGSLLNESNLDAYGKKWEKGKVINFVIKEPKAGKWKVLFTKNVGDYLGDVTIQGMPMSGFLQIKKAAAKYTEGKLKVIWQATGVSDDNCIVQIYARNGSNDILLYSGNTIDDNIRTVDMVDIDSAKISGNIYDIVIKIQDIDVSSNAQKYVTGKYIVDEYIIKNVEVPSI